jgi:hypothetical protein
MVPVHAGAIVPDFQLQEATVRLLAFAIAPVVEHQVWDPQQEDIEERVLAGRGPETRE